MQIQFNPLRSQLTQMVQVELDRLKTNRTKINDKEFIGALKELAGVVQMLEPTSSWDQWLQTSNMGMPGFPWIQTMFNTENNTHRQG